jgi:NAD+ diphosphatase
MAAFCARARNTAITVDGIEITTARWFTASELKTELNAGTVLLPPAYSVARQTIESWLSGQLQ